MMSSPPPNNRERDQQFCLRWNNYQSNLTQVFNQLFQSETFVDVTLACEGHTVKAHRLVLSACSPYFMTVLTETPCDHPVIILQGVKWVELKAIVEFMYKGEINICQDQLGSLLRVAENLKIRGLADVGGEEAEAVLTSPSDSPRVGSQFWSEDTPRKRRRLSDEPRSRSRSRSLTPGPHTPHTPTSLLDPLDPIIDLPGNISRGSSSASNPPHSLPSPSPVASLASSLSSLAHLHGPMPPPGPPLPPHLAHLPPLSPLSPLLNMHPMSRHHSPEDFEIRPGIAEMIREEERRLREFPEMAKLLESTHHWIGNPMADSYQAQVQAAWQKSWNQTQSLLQNLRFRERGPLKSWRPETMAEAIHAVLKEGLSLSQAARKYDIPYPTFVLYANRVHNLLGPSHEPGDMRPKGRGRPQRILLGAWPEEQIKGVIRAVVFRDTAVFRDGDHKENKKPTTPQIKDEAGHTQSSSNGHFTPNGTPDKSGNSTPIPPSTPSTSQPLLPGNIVLPLTTPPTPGTAIPLSSPLSKEPNRISPLDGDSRPGSLVSSANQSPSATTSGAGNSITHSLTNSTSSVPMGPHTPQSRPSSVNSNGPINGPHQNGLPNALSHPSLNNLSNNIATSINGMILPGLPSPITSNGAHPLPPPLGNPIGSPLSQHSKLPHMSPSMPPQLKQQQPTSQHSHLNHQQNPLHNNSQLQQRNPHFPHHNHQHPVRHPQNPLGPMGGPQQMLGLIAGGLSPSSIGTPPGHMARLFGEGPAHLSHRPPQPPMNAFHPGFPRAAHPAMQPIPMHNPMNSLGPRMNLDDHDPSPEAILFGKLTSSERQPFSQSPLDIGRQIASNPFENIADTTPNVLERPLMFRDALDSIKSEPEAIMN